MFRFFDILLLIYERLRKHFMLVFWTVVGLSAATTLILSLTLYVDAVYSRLLTDNLGTPPYAFRYRYVGAWEGNISVADVESVDAVVSQGFPAQIGLPVEHEARYVSGGFWNVRNTEGASLGAYNIGTLEGMYPRMEIVAGEWPPPDTESEVIPVLLSEQMLYNSGLMVGDELTLVRSGKDPVTIQITALWRPLNSADPYWILLPRFFDEIFLVEPDALWGMLEGLENPVEGVDWYLVFDGSTLRSSDVDPLLTAITNAQREVETALPGIRSDVSPEQGLKDFNADVQALQQQLVIVVLPVGGLIFYFVTMLAGMLVGRQQQEDVTLSSRGMSRRGLLMVHALMWLILAGVALLIGLGLAPLLVQMVSRTTSFLRFDDSQTQVEIIYTSQAIALGAATGLLAASSGLLMAWRTTGQTITGFKRSQARAAKAWWQRTYLDLVLLGAAVYVFFNLQAESGVVANAEDPFADPIVFLAPTLFSLGCTLLFLRAFPLILGMLARIVALGRGIALLMALRELTRSMGRYRSALLMMCFTLSLTGFTASMASTLDRSLEDTINYRIGAQGVLVVATDARTQEAQDGEGLELIGYNTVPATNLLAIEGVDQVSRVGRYPGQLVLSRQRVQGTVVGIDRHAMADVTLFREDYADAELGVLMNLFAINRTGIILNHQTADDYDLTVGQEITVQVQALGQWYETTVPILALVDYFPTLNPGEGFFMITPIDPIFELVGTELPHDIWLRLESGADKAAIEQQVREMGFPLLRWEDPEQALYEAQTAPGRRGVLGFLSVGFIAAIFLTLVASIIQSTASFRAQSTRIGALRAMGLNGRAVALYLIFSQGIAALSGVLGGTLIGITTTLMFLPLLDFSSGLPPYLVRVAWDEIILVYGVFAGILLLITLVMTVLFGRQHVSTLVRLGDV